MSRKPRPSKAFRRAQKEKGRRQFLGIPEPESKPENHWLDPNSPEAKRLSAAFDPVTLEQFSWRGCANHSQLHPVMELRNSRCCFQATKHWLQNQCVERAAWLPRICNAGFSVKLTPTRV